MGQTTYESVALSKDVVLDALKKPEQLENNGQGIFMSETTTPVKLNDEGEMEDLYFGEKINKI